MSDEKKSKEPIDFAHLGGEQVGRAHGQPAEEETDNG
jgi:hypothetical protein